LAHNSTVDDLPGIFHLVTVGSLIAFGVGRLTGVYGDGLGPPGVFWFLAMTVIPLGRVRVRATCRRLDGLAQTTVIVGAGEVGQLIAQKLARHPEYQLNVVGFVDARPRPQQLGADPLRILGTPGDLPEIVHRYG